MAYVAHPQQSPGGPTGRGAAAQGHCGRPARQRGGVPERRLGRQQPRRARAIALFYMSGSPTLAEAPVSSDLPGMVPSALRAPGRVCLGGKLPCCLSSVVSAYAQVLSLMLTTQYLDCLRDIGTSAR